MRRKKVLLFYFQLAIILLALLSIPRQISLRLKGASVAFLAPVLESFLWLKRDHIGNAKESTDTKEEVNRLQLENQLLKNELETIKEILRHDLFLESQIEALNVEGKDALIALKQLHQRDFKNLLAAQLQAIPAEVIFRSSDSWSNSLWINVGKKANQLWGREVVAKHSPVVCGTAVVGVIDYVGDQQSRVRLITESGLTPSVRVVRGQGNETRFLAKGVLQGKKEGAWRSLKPVLKGVGFNYDFPDAEGPARDLRTGNVVGEEQSLPKTPIIEVGDLLITTGMDGIFPRGLQVAKVSFIDPLKEGDFTYEIEALPSAHNLDTITAVNVLPPTGFVPDSSE